MTFTAKTLYEELKKRNRKNHKKFMTIFAEELDKIRPEDRIQITEKSVWWPIIKELTEAQKG